MLDVRSWPPIADSNYASRETSFRFHWREIANCHWESFGGLDYVVVSSKMVCCLRLVAANKFMYVTGRKVNDLFYALIHSKLINNRLSVNNYVISHVRDNEALQLFSKTLFTFNNTYFVLLILLYRALYQSFNLGSKSGMVFCCKVEAQDVTCSSSKLAKIK